MGNAQLVDSLVTRFPQKVTNIITPRERRVFAETSADDLVEVVRFLKEWGMINIGNITGLDGGERFEIIYHCYDSQGLILNLKVFTPRENSMIPSVTSVFPGVFLYERELMDLFGINVNGTPPGRRYPLPDDWPVGQYPLRKDWKGLPGKGEVNQ
ncbi:MAG TPA: NADH-quinone oxidoreductase subunit C [Bacillota bacterium]|nr:NADH-quinone oxidoreductase subunit C [Bacillota bacterium]